VSLIDLVTIWMISPAMIIGLGLILLGVIVKKGWW
jgi:hypothetical protein